MVTPRMYKEMSNYILHPSVSISGMSLIKSAKGPGYYNLGIRNINLRNIKLSKAEIKKLLEIDTFTAKLLQRR